ncbi:MAG TPA: CBS domain-containing protein [Oscillatoriaceae cyanobacterium]
MLVRDLMTREVLTVRPETPVQQIIRLLSGQAISGVPVVDGDRVVGIVSEGDLIMREKPVHAPAAIEFLGALLVLENPQRTYEELRRTVGATAADVMTKRVVTTRPEADVSEAARVMIEHDLKRLPVIENDRLVGILTRKDLVRALLS